MKHAKAIFLANCQQERPNCARNIDATATLQFLRGQCCYSNATTNDCDVLSTAVFEKIAKFWTPHAPMPLHSRLEYEVEIEMKR